MIISFLIPVYNQSEELKKCIDHIIPYRGDDIEIVINDNCSEEPIEAIVSLYNDKRLKYYCNNDNIGHPRSVIHGFRRCKGEFVFLLRTIDYVIWEEIPYIIKIIKNNPSISYITGSCLDEKLNERITYDKDVLVARGYEALMEHNRLYVHPSGSLFRKNLLDLDQIEDFQIHALTPWKISYSTHQQMRLVLSQKGDFFLISRPIWIYTYTERVKKKSVQFKKINGFFPDESYYIRTRYWDEMHWVRNNVCSDNLSFAYLRVFGRYLIYTTWQYWESMHNENWRNHYSIDEEKEIIDVDEERKKYLKVVSEIEELFSIIDINYYHEKERYIKLNIEYCKEHCK